LTSNNPPAKSQAGGISSRAKKLPTLTNLPQTKSRLNTTSLLNPRKRNIISNNDVSTFTTTRNFKSVFINKGKITIGAGNSGFDLNINVLSDGYGYPLDANKNVNQAQITSVPLPAVVWLFASMLPLIGWKRKA
jgi:hypothetical protein